MRPYRECLNADETVVGVAYAPGEIASLHPVTPARATAAEVRGEGVD